MCGNAGAKSADGVGTNGFAYEFAVAEGIEHGGVGREVAAPAHAHGGKDGDSVVGDDAFRDETRHQTEGGTYGTEGGDGEGNEGTTFKAKEPEEDYVYLVGEPCDDGHAFVGGTSVGVCGGVGAKGEHHDEGGDAEHAGDDGEANADTVLAAVEQRVEKALEDGAFALEGDLLFVASEFRHGGIELGIGLEGGTLHEAGRNDAADDGSDDTHQGTLAIAQTGHEGQHHKAHAEGGAEVGEGDELVFLKVLREVLVLRQRDDGGVVGKEGHNGAQGGDTGQVVEGFHQRAQDVLQQAHHAKLYQQLANGPHEHTDGHDVEHGLEQQMVGCLHEGVEHVGQGHAVGKDPEEPNKKDQEDDGLDAAFAGEFKWVLEYFSEHVFSPVGIFGGHCADGVM